MAALALGLAVSSPLISHAQKNYKPTKENLAAREKFRDRGFGSSSTGGSIASLLRVSGI